MEQLVIGIDHGYRNMKTAHSCFTSAISELESLPDDLEGILEYDNKVYTINGKDICSVDVHDKTQSREYYLLTLVALAKELLHRGVQKASVRLAVGLPLKWYDKQQKDFKKLLGRRKNVYFRFEGKGISVTIDNVNVYTQGTVAATAAIYKSQTNQDDLLIVDIGGETFDVISIVKGKLDREHCYVETKGMIWLYKKLHDSVRTELYEDVPDSFIEKYIHNGRRNVIEKNKYNRVLQKNLVEYSDEVFRILKNYKFNLELVPMVVIGGGGTVIQNFGDHAGYDIEFNEDIHANAIGYEVLESAVVKRGK